MFVFCLSVHGPRASPTQAYAGKLSAVPSLVGGLSSLENTATLVGCEDAGMRDVTSIVPGASETVVCVGGIDVMVIGWC